MNCKYNVRPKRKMIVLIQGVDAFDAKAIADYLWSQIGTMAEYFAITELPNEYSQIITSWNQCKPGRCILERHQKNSVFISAEDGPVYMLKGLFSTCEVMLRGCPVLLDEVLISF